MGTLKAIANDPDGKASIEAAVIEDGRTKTKVALKFDTRQAIRGVEQLVEHQKILEERDSADYQRVLMIFTQANIKDAPVGRKTSERAKIEAISDRDLPLIYASELAEQRIKHEIREADDNL